MLVKMQIEVDLRNIRDVLNVNFGNLEARSQQTTDITGIATGYRDLDHMTTGLHEEELIILAARPAVGKTAFALNIAQNIGTKLDKTVAIFFTRNGCGKSSGPYVSGRRFGRIAFYPYGSID